MRLLLGNRINEMQLGEKGKKEYFFTMERHLKVIDALLKVELDR
jgi:hypothetical protein